MKQYAHIALLVFVTAQIFLPLGAAHAASFPYWGPILSCGGAGNVPGLPGSPCNLCHAVQTTQNIIFLALTVLVLVIAPILFVVSGIMILVSGGNPGLLTRGRKAFYGTVIGVAIGLVAFAIVDTFLVLIAPNFSSTAGSSWNNIRCDTSLIPTGLPF